MTEKSGQIRTNLHSRRKTQFSVSQKPAETAPKSRVASLLETMVRLFRYCLQDLNYEFVQC